MANLSAKFLDQIKAATPPGTPEPQWNKDFQFGSTQFVYFLPTGGGGDGYDYEPWAEVPGIAIIPAVGTRVCVGEDFTPPNVTRVLEVALRVHAYTQQIDVFVVLDPDPSATA